MNNIVFRTKRSKQGRRSFRSIDAHVGACLRTRRIIAGLTQSELGAATGVTFQQVQKYEKATNRISASQLYAFAQRLNCSPDDFFEGLNNNSGTTAGFDPVTVIAVDGAKELLLTFASLDERGRNVVLTVAKLLSA